MTTATWAEALQDGRPEALASVVFPSTLLVPLKGVTKYGRESRGRSYATRSVRKVQHLKVFTTEADLVATMRAPQWHERFTGRELVLATPAGGGWELFVDGEGHLLPPDLLDALRAPAQAAVDEDRALARRAWPSSVPVADDRRTGFDDGFASLLKEHMSGLPGWPPAGPATARCRVRMAGDAVQAQLVVESDEGTVELPVPEALVEEARAHRLRSFRPGVGTWFVATATVEALHGSVWSWATREVDDHEPAWDPPVPDDVYRVDQGVFPRSERWMPDWLLQKLVDRGGEAL